jgi:hypothetical protein
MEKKIFLLEAKENSRVVKIFQLVFGIFCIGIAIFWAIFYLTSKKAEARMWITIVFLAGFGFYQVFAGLGKILRYIETGPDKIKLKQNSFLPAIELKSADIEMIEIYPLSLAFHLKNRKKSILRFGITYTEIIDPVKDAIIEFAFLNKIQLEEKAEEL